MVGTSHDDDNNDAPSSSSFSSSSWSPSLVALVSGGVGGACSVLIGHPLDLVKVQMQTTSTSSRPGKSSHTIRGMLAETLKTGGIVGPNGIFRGLAPPLLTVVPTTAVAFWGYDVGRRLVLHYDGTREEGEDGGGMGWWKTSTTNTATSTPVAAPPPPSSPRPLTTAEVCVAGAISAVPTTLIVAPTERIKCLLQVQQDIGKGGGGGRDTERRRRIYSGTFDCTRGVYREGGLRSLYRGTGMTFVRGMPGTMAYFAAYEYAKDGIASLQRRGGIMDDDVYDDVVFVVVRSQSPPPPPSTFAILIAGGFAGIAYWAVGIPIIADVLKSRYQTAPIGKYPGGYVDVYRSLIREDGYAGLFKGFRPAMMRAIPASMARSIGMEVTRRILE